MISPLLSVLAGCLAAAEPQTPPAMTEPPPEPSRHATLALVCEHTSIAPGSTASVGIKFTIEPGWHIYWIGWSDSGAPPSVEWTLPQGFTAGALQWPAPKRHVSPGAILDHVFENQVLLPVRIEIPSTAESGANFTLNARVDYLICCKDLCIPESSELSLSLPMNNAVPALNLATMYEFTKTRAKLPAPLPPGSPLKITWAADSVEVAYPGAVGLTFFPDRGCVELANPLADADTPGDTLKLRVAPGAQATSPLSGVIYVKRPKFSIGNAKPVGSFDDVFAVKSERRGAGSTPAK